jgi:predicted alpha/beta-fold hydrolase
MDLRGCGNGMALARRPYHGGCSDDVRAAAEAITRWSPQSHLVVIGFSLGGNIALKLAGEASDRPLPNLAAVVAVSPPIDMVRCCELLASPRNRIYEMHYVRGLTRQVRQRRAMHASEPAVIFPRRLGMRIFDDLYTAPIWGFDGALDYYRRASALPLIPRISVPTFILTAADDPFIAVQSFESLRAPTNVEVSILPHGGHLGFLGRNSTGGVRWAECRVAEWVLQTCKPPTSEFYT